MSNKSNKSPWANGTKMEEKCLGRKAQEKMLFMVFGQAILRDFQKKKLSKWTHAPEKKGSTFKTNRPQKKPPSPWGW